MGHIISSISFFFFFCHGAVPTILLLHPKKSASHPFTTSLKLVMSSNSGSRIALAIRRYVEWSEMF